MIKRVSYLVLFILCSCATNTHHYIDWSKTPENPVPYKFKGITTNHFKLFGDVKYIYGITYRLYDSVYKKISLEEATFNTSQNIETLKFGLFKFIGNGYSYHYEKKNRLLYQLRIGIDTLKGKSYYYNKKGQLISQNNNSTFRNLKYDKKGNLISETYLNSGFYDVIYKYDDKNRLIFKKTLSPNKSKESSISIKYSTIKDTTFVEIEGINNKGERFNIIKKYDPYGYKLGPPTTKEKKCKDFLKRDHKNNVVEHICGINSTYYLIEYWDGTTSGFDPELFLQF